MTFKDEEGRCVVMTVTPKRTGVYPAGSAEPLLTMGLEEAAALAQFEQYYQ